MCIFMSPLHASCFSSRIVRTQYYTYTYRTTGLRPFVLFFLFSDTSAADERLPLSFSFHHVRKYSDIVNIINATEHDAIIVITAWHRPKRYTAYIFLSGPRNVRPGGLQVQLGEHDVVQDSGRRESPSGQRPARDGAISTGRAEHATQKWNHPGDYDVVFIRYNNVLFIIDFRRFRFRTNAFYQFDLKTCVLKLIP